jgi:hypothetical protein
VGHGQGQGKAGGRAGSGYKGQEPLAAPLTCPGQRLI